MSLPKYTSGEEVNLGDIVYSNYYKCKCVVVLIKDKSFEAKRLGQAGLINARNLAHWYFIERAEGEK